MERELTLEPAALLGAVVAGSESRGNEGGEHERSGHRGEHHRSDPGWAGLEL